jgi:hypothetical protein
MLFYMVGAKVEKKPVNTSQAHNRAPTEGQLHRPEIKKGGGGGIRREWGMDGLLRRQYSAVCVCVGGGGVLCWPGRGRCQRQVEL